MEIFLKVPVVTGIFHYKENRGFCYTAQEVQKMPKPGLGAWANPGRKDN
jgi:hypothetical protein